MEVMSTADTLEASAIASAAGDEAIKKTKEAVIAKEVARIATMDSLFAKIEETFSKQNESNLQSLKVAVVDVVQDALGKEPTRYFDASRIPLICKSIFEMHLQLKLIMWIMGITGSAVIIGLVGKFLKLV